MRTTAFAALAAALLALPVHAQSGDALAGSWTMEHETPRGTMTQTLTFALEDGVWAGTMANDRRSFDLQEVSFEDGRVTFSVEMGPPPGRGMRGGRGPGGDGERSMVATFEGVLDGDEIRGEMDGPRGDMPLVLTRKSG